MEETEQASESNRYSKDAGMINMLRILTDQVYIIQEHMCIISWETNSKKEIEKKNLEFKNSVTEMKNAFDGLINRVDTGEENFWPWGYRSFES